MTIEELVSKIFNRSAKDDATIIHFSGKNGSFLPIPDHISHNLRSALEKLSINELYIHQAQAIEAALSKKNTVIATPTASGKTLCFNIPVLSEIAENPSARALYLYPTKALSADQSAGLQELIDASGLPVKMHTYDGDTPVSARQVLRNEGSIILTNPDMLHSAILPQHTKWINLFENLKYVVIDELHQYRGVFGSHMANLVRRLRRICTFYGSHPVFIMSSATIKNPGELASNLIEDDVTVISEDGSPRGDKYLVVYNPPIVEPQLRLRRSVMFEARKFATELIKNGIQTIVFARARTTVENILRLLKDDARSNGISPESIRGYRGGYLPLERREIEKGLRDGRILGVVSTNALELGIDIGRLEAAIVAGYPGTIASLRQQMGRAGRKQQSSLGILILSGSPLDQYIAQNPKFLLTSPPESGLINPDNLYIMVSHIKCAAFELPFVDGEMFGRAEITPVLEHLESHGVVNHANGKWFWMTEVYPADEVSLRNAAKENVVIMDTTDAPNIRTIGEVDLFGAPMLVHDQAVYIHEGVSYHVDKLDFEARKAFVRRVNVDYYTDANLEVNLSVLDELGRNDIPAYSSGFGEVSVTAITTLFKKIKMNTHENLGFGEVRLPERPMDTTSWWLVVSQRIVNESSPNDLANALKGLGNLLIGILPLPLMCDPRDLSLHVQVKSPHFGRPTIFIYETNAGGVGLSQHIFDLGSQALAMALETLDRCGCADGCPACIGPAGETEAGTKEKTRKLIGMMMEERIV
ncbi:MAG: DEAD/DEAH box helicase [Caldisericia bacterium]|nr:DEAD/DEAH box helicase [Caldisericia bacterium]